MTPQIKVGSYGSAGTGVIQSVAIGFVPDYLVIYNMVNPSKVYAAFPSRVNFSNGTAIRIASNLGAVGATGNNHAGDTTPGSYVMAMGGPNDLSTSTKQKGFYVGKKLTVAAKYNYIAFRSGAGEQGGATSAG